ncbi:MAG: DegT/DnrJ/EryC1/StrS aminotransferase family protein [Spirochaetaceae bacterium]|jgi:dTDP-4-amino-4,6-dideoxygalactose transaminase|nr:DegT/DnrJ/EryC1/StrS aminotransferase family protein [Spirochaetaceae bacterium]
MIPFARPHIGAEEEEAVLRVLRSGWLTTAAEALAFETEFARFLEGAGAAALAVNSATSGLHLALEACGVGPGDLVALPSYTFAATAGAVRYLGAEPVFVDIAPGTFHLDPSALERTLKRLAGNRRAYRFARGDWGPAGAAKAVIPVHFGGLPCDMDAITAIAKEYSLKIIEDAAHAFPSRLASGAWAGAIGDAGVFSFYATKTITTGEGGMVVTKNPETASRMRIMRSHGIDRSIWNRYTDTKAPWYYQVAAPGYKYNMPDLLAAIGRVQLGKARGLLAMRKEIAAGYDAAFAGDGRFILPPTGEGDARHLYPLRFRGAGGFRDQCIEKLRDVGVGVSVHFIPLHTMPYYKKQYGFEDGDFPESLAAFKGEVSLPIWPGMEAAHVQRVIDAVLLSPP